MQWKTQEYSWKNDGYHCRYIHWELESIKKEYKEENIKNYYTEGVFGILKSVAD